MPETRLKNFPSVADLSRGELAITIGIEHGDRPLLEPRPPFPLGHPLEEADPALLDPVRARAPFWRPA